MPRDFPYLYPHSLADARCHRRDVQRRSTVADSDRILRPCQLAEPFFQFHNLGPAGEVIAGEHLLHRLHIGLVNILVSIIKFCISNRNAPGNRWFFHIILHKSR